MNASQIALLFGLFAGPEVVAESYETILEIAVLEVRGLLRPCADEADPRLCYFAAAVAFQRYTEITAARDRTACTFAGTIAENTDARQKLVFAQSLTAAYQRLCRELLRDDAFLFCAV